MTPTKNINVIKVLGNRKFVFLLIRAIIHNKNSITFSFDSLKNYFYTQKIKKGQNK